MIPLLGLAACGRSHATGYPGYALITAAGGNNLAIVNLNTFRLTGQVDLGSAPSSVVSDGENGYVLTPKSGLVHVIDPARARKRASFHFGDEIDLLRLTPDGDRLVAVSGPRRELLVADSRTGKIQRRFQVSGAPAALDVRVNGANKRTWAALSTRTGAVELFDLENGAHRSRHYSGELGRIQFRDDGELLFAANAAGRSLLVIEPETLGLICELPLPMKPENLSFGAEHGQLFISGPGMDGVSIIYTYNTLEVDQTVLAGRAPGAMACSETPRYLFVASRAGSEISILDIDSRKIVALMQAGDRPSRILITPDQQYALILNEGSGDMAVIRIPEIRGKRLRPGEGPMPAGILTLRGVSLFAMIPVGDQPTDIAIANQRA